MFSKRTWLALSGGMILFANLAVAGVSEEAMQAYNIGDYAKAHHLLEAQAKKANPEAEFLMGIMYSRGHGVIKDSEKAVSWWSKAASRGNAEAQEAMAESYATGVGVKQDWTKAAQWAEKSAAKGNPNAQYLLGSLYEKGSGVKASSIDAHMWYSIAAGWQGGNPAATEAVARLEKAMTPADVAAAKAKADKWKATHQKSADKKK